MSSATVAAPAALKLSRILAPVEFSDRCRHAVESAATLARRFHAELILLHAVAPAPVAFGVPEALAYTPPPDLTIRQIADDAAELESFMGGDVARMSSHRVVVEDDPAHAILDYAVAKHCDLIVMPTHGYGALHRLIAGSVTNEVIHHAPCPVWTGPRCDDPGPSGFHSVFCALGLEKGSGRVLAWAAAFAREYGAALHVAHAIPMSTVRVGALYFDPEWHIAVAKDARHFIDGLLRECGAKADVSIEIGDIPDAVVAKAREAAADLVVIGRGSHSYSIIRESPCSVVAV